MLAGMADRCLLCLESFKYEDGHWHKWAVLSITDASSINQLFHTHVEERLNYYATIIVKALYKWQPALKTREERNGNVQ